MDTNTRNGMVEFVMRMNVTDIKNYAKSIDVKIPSTLKKTEMVHYLVGVIIERQQGAVLLSPNKRVVSYSQVHLIRIPPGELGSDNQEWRSRLLNYGVAVVKIPDFDPSVYRRQFWDWIYSCNTGIVEGRKETWSMKGLPHSVRGMFKSFIGHQPFIWEIREKCHPIYASIWGTEDLLCSFDGAALNIPDQSNRESWESWFHYDQGRFNTEFCCVQGVVYLTDVNAGDPGFVFIEDSHKLFRQHLETYPSSGYVWQTFDPTTHVVLKGQRLIMPVVKAGEMVLWDSRVAHSTLPGFGTNYRMVTYVSMMPRVHASSEELQKRISYYESNRMTGHWCYGPFFMATEKEPYKHGEQYNRPPEYAVPPLISLPNLRKKMIGVSPELIAQMDMVMASLQNQPQNEVIDLGVPNFSHFFPH